jgi:hypothetical protein
MKNTSLFLSALLALSTITIAKADEYTTVRTTTISTNGSTFSLPAGRSFVVVDPIAGDVKGVYDPVNRLLNGQPLVSGMIVSDRVTGKLIAVVDASGNLVDISVAPVATTLLDAIDRRRTELNQLLTNALAAGTVTAGQAHALQVELDNLAAAEVLAKQSGQTLTYSQALPIAYNLNVFGSKLVPIIKTEVMPIIGQRIIATNGQIILSDDVTFRRVAMEAKVDAEYGAGHLSADHVSSLKNKLNKVAVQQAKYTKHGELRSSEKAKLDRQLDLAQDSFNKNIAEINAKRARIGIRAD